DSIERGFRKILQVDEEIGRLRLQSLMPAGGDGLLAEIDPFGGDSGGAHHFQKLPAAAADIEYIAALREVGEIELLAGLDVLLGAAEAVGKAAVVEAEFARHGGFAGP